MLHSIERNSDYDDKTFDQTGMCGRYGHQVQTIVQKTHQDCTEDRSGNRTFAAQKGDAADDRCSDNIIRVA